MVNVLNSTLLPLFPPVSEETRRTPSAFSSVVLEIADEHFENLLLQYEAEKGYKVDTEMTAEDWKFICDEYKHIVILQYGKEFPQDPVEQIRLATIAVFKSWMGKRAIDYRTRRVWTPTSLAPSRATQRQKPRAISSRASRLIRSAG